MLSPDLPVLCSRLGQCSCLLNQAPVTRGSLSCRKMKRQAQAQVLETGDCNPHKIGIKLGFNNLNESKINLSSKELDARSHLSCSDL